MTFVLTGTLASMSREQAAETIRARGGTVTGSVTGNTRFLVVGRDPGARKREQARALGVPEIAEQDLLRLLGQTDAKKGTAPRQDELFSR